MSETTDKQTAPDPTESYQVNHMPLGFTLLFAVLIAIGSAYIVYRLATDFDSEQQFEERMSDPDNN